MTPENFSAFLKSPESHTISINHLEQLIEKYPYVQSLRIALLKKLEAENHPDFEKQLVKTATYAYDRTFLRKYIKGENIYVLEYPINQVEGEIMDTLDLVPLKSLKDFTNTDSKLEIVNTTAVKEVVELKQQTLENEVFDLRNEESLLDSLDEILEDSDVVTTVLESDKIEVENKEFDLVESLAEESSEILEDSDVVTTALESDKIEVEELPDNTEKLKNNNEKVEDMQEVIIENKSLEDKIQHLIIDSKKVDYHAPIEENIDHLIDEDELEGLDDEIEFGFEIDKKIITSEEGISIFDTEVPVYHVEHHHEATNHYVEKHEKESNAKEVDLPLEDIELSSDNIFNKDDLRQEGDLFFLDDRSVTEELQEVESTQDAVPSIDFVPSTSDYENEDAEDFPEEFEAAEAKVESRENVEQIKAVLSETNSKETKKSKIKQYLQRIAQIPLEEESIISETYAGLLAKQGKIERSIRMYQQLILKNPQKKVYFAAKIKQLIKSI